MTAIKTFVWFSIIRSSIRIIRRQQFTFCSSPMLINIWRILRKRIGTQHWGWKGEWRSGLRSYVEKFTSSKKSWQGKNYKRLTYVILGKQKSKFYSVALFPLDIACVEKAYINNEHVDRILLVGLFFVVGFFPCHFRDMIQKTSHVRLREKHLLII